MYVYDLIIFLCFKGGYDEANNENIKFIQMVLDEIFVLSGLDINKTKTMLTLFGRQEDKFSLAERVEIKWCKILLC